MKEETHGVQRQKLMGHEEDKQECRGEIMRTRRTGEGSDQEKDQMKKLIHHLRLT